jgi:peptide/nickel transport system substrate-binding protein
LVASAVLVTTGMSTAFVVSTSSASTVSGHAVKAKAKSAPSVVNLAFTADMGVPDPDIFYSVEGNVVMTSIYEGLVQYANDSTKIVPDLATSWTISPNGLTYTFQLRPHVLFHDGNGPMTSTDVEASFKRRAALGATSPPGYMVADIASYSTPSPLVFVVHLKTPLAPFMDELAAPYGPKVEDAKGLAEHAGSNLDQTYLATHDLGTGPYTITQFVPGEHYTLTSFPKWWGGVPQVKEIHISIIPDISTQILELESGQLQMIMHGLSVQDESSFENNSKFQIQRFPAELELLMELNEHSGIFTDKALRLAVDEAINRSQIVSDIYGNDATVATQIFPSGELTPSLGRDDPTYAPSHLAKLVSGLKNKSVNIEYTVDDARNERVADIIQTELESAGLNATVHGIPLSVAYDLSAEPKQRPDMLITTTNPDDAAPDSWLHIYLHSVSPLYGSLNYLDCETPAADAAEIAGMTQTSTSAYDADDGQAGDDITAAGCYLDIADIRDVVVADSGYSNWYHQAPTVFTVKFGLLKLSGGS